MTAYPESVKEWVAETEVLLDDFFTNSQMFSDEIVARETYREVAGRKALKYWLDTGEIVIADDDLIEILNHVVIESAMKVLQARGMVDSVEDTDGELIYWPTEKGMNFIKDHPENLK